MTSKTILLTALFAVPVWAFSGCRGDERVRQLIDDRLVEKGLIKAEKKQPIGLDGGIAQSAAQVEPENPAKASALFLAKMERLMEGYEPDLPTTVDDSDLLRCLTQYAIQSDMSLKEISKQIRKSKEQSSAEINKKRKEFYNDIYPRNFRIDYDWETRPYQNDANAADTPTP